ncbi:MAG: tRNA pseudouridine(55) synthase TruB [Clostridia bacterium]|nr:tRNA pseudouridine(55) synthase TruB [Clostridia bacterium]
MVEDGLIVLNKPKGMSSFFAVKIVKRALKANKAGHMGTLDPLATGVLVIGINKATKLFDKFLKGNKEYIAEYEFGYETDTLDCEGNITNKNQILVTKEMLEKILPKFLGKQMQVPPNYSAKKIDGKKAYDLARIGVEFSIPPKQVEVFGLELLEQIKQNTFAIKIKCSSGFYVRSLGRDLAKELSTYATTINITRTICCGFGIEEAQSLEEIKSGNFDLKPIK